MHLLLDFVKSQNASADMTDGQAVACSVDTIIAGGGAYALETAAVCRDKGAENVTVVFRESDAEIGLAAEEKETLQQKGIHILLASGINRLFGDAEQLKEIEILELNTKKSTMLKADTLIIASGRFPELIFRRPKAPESEEEAQPAEETPENTLWEGFYPNKYPDYAEESGLLAEGDVLSDYSGAIKAIGAGRRAAASIHKVLYDIELPYPQNVLTATANIQDVDEIDKVSKIPRTIMPLASSRELTEQVELEKGFSEEAAAHESARCLQCGLICYERTQQE
jgi:thioredoxin reductase